MNTQNSLDLNTVMEFFVHQMAQMANLVQELQTQIEELRLATTILINEIFINENLFLLNQSLNSLSCIE